MARRGMLGQCEDEIQTVFKAKGKQIMTEDDLGGGPGGRGASAIEEGLRAARKCVQ